MPIKFSDYEYCPYCASRLSVWLLDGVQRKVCTYCHCWTHYPSAGQASAGIVVRRNKVLLVKRNRDPYKDTWGFPAGFVEYGEHPEEALKRELEQETGLIVGKAKFIRFVQSLEDPRSPGHLVFFYYATAKGKIKNNDLQENQEVGWFDIKSPPEIGWPTHQEMMRQLQKKNRKRKER